MAITALLMQSISALTALSFLSLPVSGGSFLDFNGVALLDAFLQNSCDKIRTLIVAFKKSKVTFF